MGNCRLRNLPCSKANCINMFPRSFRSPMPQAPIKSTGSYPSANPIHALKSPPSTKIRPSRTQVRNNKSSSPYISNTVSSRTQGAGTNVRINCYLPTATCTNSSIDCSHNAGLRTATFCQLSDRFHLVNSSIFVTHMFGLLPTLLARGCHSNARFAVRGGEIFFVDGATRRLTQGCHTISVQQTTLFANSFHSLCADRLVEGMRDLWNWDTIMGPVWRPLRVQS